MSQAVVCPECDVSLQLKQRVKEGAKIRCPKCKNVFAPSESASAIASAPAPRRASRPADFDDDPEDEPRRRPERGRRPARGRPREDDDYEERPRPRRKSSRSGSNMTLWLCIGGGGLVVVAIIVGLVLLLGGGGVNEAQFKKLKPNMTDKQVIAILGSPDEDSKDLADFAGNFGGVDLGKIAPRVMAWQSGNNTITATFIGGKLTMAIGQFGNKTMQVGMPGGINLPGFKFPNMPKFPKFP